MLQKGKKKREGCGGWMWWRDVGGCGRGFLVWCLSERASERASELVVDVLCVLRWKDERHLEKRSEEAGKEESEACRTRGARRRVLQSSA